MKNFKNCCSECPYKRKSERGFVTGVEERKGFYGATHGIVSSLEVICHMRTEGMCAGSIKHNENKIVPDLHKNVFNTGKELQEHHTIFEGPLPKAIVLHGEKNV